MSQLQKKKKSPFLHLLVPSGLLMDWMMPTLLVRAGPLHGLLNPMLVSQKHAPGHTQKCCAPVWMSLRPVKLTHKIGHHNGLL